jgi:hypothetical protein
VEASRTEETIDRLCFELRAVSDLSISSVEWIWTRCDFGKPMNASTSDSASSITVASLGNFSRSSLGIFRSTDPARVSHNLSR